MIKQVPTIAGKEYNEGCLKCNLKKIIVFSRDEYKQLLMKEKL